MAAASKEKKKRTKKDFSIRSLLNVCKYSYQGLEYFYKYERSAILHLISAILMLLAAYLLQMTPMEWLVIIFVLMTTLSVELLNTAIEAVCDRITTDFDPNIKIAKDCGSAATGVLTLVGIVVILIVYLPKVWHFIGGLF